MSRISAIKQIIEKVKAAPGLATELSDSADLINDVGLDSLEMLRFMLELEEQLSIEIDFEALEYSYFHSLRTLAEFLDTMPSQSPPSSAL
jgi:acyl carrier protein